MCDAFNLIIIKYSILVTLYTFFPTHFKGIFIHIFLLLSLHLNVHIYVLLLHIICFLLILAGAPET